jgi:glycine cleavage system transcriptional repressor
MLKKHIVLSVLSKDRPGIIADIANVIFELEGDLADMSQSVLDGFFSMIVIAQFDAEITEQMIQEKILNLNSKTELNCIVREINETSISQTQSNPGDIYVVTGQGKNRTGLVAAIGSFCRDHSINIIDYDTKLSGNTYSMILDIDIPSTLSPDKIHEKLHRMAQNLGLKIVMQHKDLFKTVNEISL